MLVIVTCTLVFVLIQNTTQSCYLVGMYVHFLNYNMQSKKHTWKYTYSGFRLIYLPLHHF